MRLSLFWFIDGLRKAHDKDAVVVIDATRFSCTIITALSVGIEKIIPITEIEDYAKYVDDRSKFVLAMEHDDATKPLYADIGNSPGGLLRMQSAGRLKGKSLMVIRTSAGSHLLYTANSLGLRNVIIGSFPNAQAVGSYLVTEGFHDVAIVCAGFKRTSFALDDYLAAGSITSEILRLRPDVEMDEELLGAQLAYEGTLRLGLSIGKMILERMKVRKDLERVGEIGDAYVAAEVNKYSVVPILREGLVVDALKR
jgi:phosphosulfolactate phosphohydrolase-like enzyme